MKDLHEMMEIAQAQEDGGFHFKFILVTADGREFEAEALDPWFGMVVVPSIGEGFTLVGQLSKMGCKAKLVSEE